MPATATYRYADHLLNGGLTEFVTKRRETGRSWRLIARDLYDATAGQIDIAHETLRGWFPEAA